MIKRLPYILKDFVSKNTTQSQRELSAAQRLRTFYYKTPKAARPEWVGVHAEYAWHLCLSWLSLMAAGREVRR